MLELAKRWRWGASLAGAPDKSFTELRAAEAVLRHLEWQVTRWEKPPQPHLCPDVIATRADGRRVGVEVTELRYRRSAQRAQAVKEGKEKVHLYRVWDSPTIQTAVGDAILRKDTTPRTWDEPLDEYFVVVHTDEPLLNHDVARAALTHMAPVECSQVMRAFFILWYVPREVGPRPRVYEITVLS